MKAKNIWALFCLLLLLSFGCARDQKVVPKETKQKILPTGFSYFENLYFNAPSRTFFTYGGNVRLKYAIYNEEERGFQWKAYRKTLPIPLKKHPTTSVPGTTVVLFERALTPIHFCHFYHFLEHLLGIWNFGGEELRSEVKLFLLAGSGEMKRPDHWQGPNDATAHLIKALFPHAEVKLWVDFVEETKGNLCFEKVITSDRCMEYRKKEPFLTDRILGGYFQSLTTKSLEQMAAVVQEYAQAQRKKTEKKIVTYVTRPPNRCLTQQVERELIDRVAQLPNIELHIVDFAALSFKEQIKIVAQTDILLGVHGNGLSHTLFLPPGATLIELFPKESLRVEYRLFAKARGLNYHAIVSHKGKLDDWMLERIGCFGPLGGPIDEIDIEAILSIIQGAS